MNNIKNENDTTVSRTFKQGICECCYQWSPEILEIAYTIWKQAGPDYMTPDGRQTDLVCDNCFDEVY